MAETKKSNVFCIGVAIDSKGKTAVKGNENYHVPIGALCGFNVTVTVDGEPVTVTSSTWTVNGEQVDDVIQSDAEGVATIINGPREIEGDPDGIQTAWISTGVQQITIEGVAVFDGAEIPFTTQGTATVLAPTVTVESPAAVNDTGRWNNDVVGVFFTTGQIKMNVPQLLANGTGGFLQMISGERFRGPKEGDPSQDMGSAMVFLDTSKKNLFYDGKTLKEGSNELSTNDEPTMTVEQKDSHFPDKTFNWYGIGTTGGADTRKENFDTYVAFKAPIGNGVIESYIVISNLVKWWWNATLTYKGGLEGWSLDDYDSDCETWSNPGEWSLPMWTSNSTALLEWRNNV